MRVLYVDNDQVTNYISEVHLRRSCKFLYWKDELLLVGRMGLKPADGLNEGMNTHRCTAEMARYFKISLPNRLPEGAGELFAGEVDGWKSFGYKVITPHELKAEILDALGVE